MSAISLSMLAQTGSTITAPPGPIPTYHFRLSDPITLPIGAPGSPVSAVFGCTNDDSVFLQVATLPGNDSDYADLALYQVRGPTDIVRFNPRFASGLSLISPIARYFAAESKVVALAYGVPIDAGQATPDTQSKKILAILLTFDRKGTLSSANPLDATLRPEQVAVYDSGDLLLVAFDELRKKTYLLVTDSSGSIKREIHGMDNDPADLQNATDPLVTLQIYSYGKNLLLIPQDTHRAILEVNEYGIVNTYKLHIPTKYERGLPISLSRRSWKFRMIANQSAEQTALSPPATAAGNSANPPIGLEALQSAHGAVVEFDPDNGSILRQIDLPSSGFQPACERNGEYIFISAHAGDGKLQLARAVVGD